MQQLLPPQRWAFCGRKITFMILHWATPVTVSGTPCAVSTPSHTGFRVITFRERRCTSVTSHQAHAHPPTMVRLRVKPQQPPVTHTHTHTQPHNRNNNKYSRVKRLHFGITVSETCSFWFKQHPILKVVMPWPWPTTLLQQRDPTMIAVWPRLTDCEVTSIEIPYRETFADYRERLKAHTTESFCANATFVDWLDLSWFEQWQIWTQLCESRVWLHMCTKDRFHFVEKVALLNMLSIAKRWKSEKFLWQSYAPSFSSDLCTNDNITNIFWRVHLFNSWFVSKHSLLNGCAYVFTSIRFTCTLNDIYILW